LQNDSVGMTQQLAWLESKPDIVDDALDIESQTSAYYGRLGKARELSRRAVALGERAGDKDSVARYETNATLREALFGNTTEARQLAAAVLNSSTSRLDVHFFASLALAIAGDAARASSVVDDFTKRFPENTIVQFNYLPTLRAQLALGRHDATSAVSALEVAAPYELGQSGHMYPSYVRGRAYLALRQGQEGATEFQKILDHRGIVGNDPIGALAHLQIGRAYAMQGDTPKAKAAYQDFLTLWKDADPDIPVLIAAKAEYAKLK